MTLSFLRAALFGSVVLFNPTAVVEAALRTYAIALDQGERYHARGHITVDDTETNLGSAIVGFKYYARFFNSADWSLTLSYPGSCCFFEITDPEVPFTTSHTELIVPDLLIPDPNVDNGFQLDLIGVDSTVDKRAVWHFLPLSDGLVREALSVFSSDGDITYGSAWGQPPRPSHGSNTLVLPSMVSIIRRLLQDIGNNENLSTGAKRKLRDRVREAIRTMKKNNMARALDKLRLTKNKVNFFRNPSHRYHITEDVANALIDEIDSIIAYF